MDKRCAVVPIFHRQTQPFFRRRPLRATEHSDGESRWPLSIVFQIIILHASARMLRFPPYFDPLDQNCYASFSHIATLCFSPFAKV